jgi:SpoVK/Ycf46/Vps4 family AAA+-type ATPase
MIRSMEEFVSVFHAARCVSTPLVAIRTADPASTTYFLTDALRQGRQPPPLLGWDVIRGLYAIGNDSGEELARVLGDREAATAGPADALSLAQQLGENGLLLYSNARRFWDERGVMQGIWNLRDSFKATGRMLVLLAVPGATLPMEFESSLVGASTERLRTALKIIDAVSQDRMLFIATCNSIASLPPELRRRFTLGTFFFDPPTEEEREIIWQICFKRYGVTGDLPNGEGWTGAEIKECCRKAHRLGMTLVQAAKYIVPVSRSAAEQVKALRQMASGKFISASTPRIYQYRETAPVHRGRVMRELDGPLTVMPRSNSEA